MFIYSPLDYFVSHNRPSSPGLAQAAVTGVRTMGGEVKDYGVVTTPMLHYFVACINTGGAYGEPTEDGYFKKIITAFKKLRGDVSFVSRVYCIFCHTLHSFRTCFVA
jgi:phosphoacetylglucosamine mutase